jgi:hypothetical protein
VRVSRTASCDYDNGKHSKAGNFKAGNFKAGNFKAGNKGKT